METSNSTQQNEGKEERKRKTAKIGIWRTYNPRFVSCNCLFVCLLVRPVSIPGLEGEEKLGESTWRPCSASIQDVRPSVRPARKYMGM